MRDASSHTILSRLSAVGVLSLLAGCGPDYDLSLQPLVPQNQTPFSNIDRIDVVLEHEDGSNQRFSLDSTQGSPSLDRMGILSGTRIRLDATRSSQVVASGRTGRLDLTTGDAAQNIYISEVNQMGWLEDHEHGLFGTSLVSLGEGRFLAFGGIDLKSTSSPGKKGKNIFELNLGEPSNPIAFEDLGEMPSYMGDHESSSSEVTARHGATATLLDSGPYAGYVLVAGGSPRLFQSEDITASAFLFHPDTGDTVVLGPDQEMDTGHYLHLAVRDATGNVVLLGGWEATDPDFIAMNNRFEFFDASAGEFDQKLSDRTLRGAGMYGMAAPLGTSGVVHCGGAIIRGGTAWDSRPECTLITTSGAVSDEIPDLPIPLSHGSMIAVSDFELLVFGGVSAPSEQLIASTVPAESVVIYYNHRTQKWRELDGLQLARANAGLGLLPDGRVLVAGGRQSVHLFDYGATDSDEVLACVELYDPSVALNQPTRDASTLQNGCTTSQETSDLPTRMHSLATAQDGVHGLLAAGGLNADGTSPAVMHWRFPPSD